MKIHELQVTPAKDRKRVGRGIGSGYGKTAGRGTKGQNARTGGGVRVGFAGGQNPLAKLLPKKRGFKALSSVTYQVVNISDLAGFKEGSVVDNAELAKAGLIKRAGARVKLLGEGDFSGKLTVKVQAASKPAAAALEKAGSTLELTPLPRTHSKKATRPKADESTAKSETTAL